MLLKVYFVSVVCTFLVAYYMILISANRKLKKENKKMTFKRIAIGFIITFIICLIPIFNVAIMLSSITTAYPNKEE
jgi:undecaprenyl pyrophosphate phosphatase UppP